MLAKLIVWAPDRERAIARMHRALLELTVHGIETSRDFHLRVMEDEEFRRGAIEIQWLERRLPSIIGTAPPDAGVRAAAIAAALLAHRDRTGRVGTSPNGRATNGGSAAAPSSPVAESRDGWKQAARREAVGDR
jgi:acetyl-CoA carboxylase, biotin carboxylase subunit